MARHVVTGPQAVVIVAGRRTYLGHGAVVPEGADEARLEHLVAVGLVSEAPEPEPAASEAVAETKPADKPSPARSKTAQ